MFFKEAQYLVLQGTYEGFVFSPKKISSCGEWGWINKMTRVHIKHTELIGTQRHNGPAYELNAAISSRKNKSGFTPQKKVKRSIIKRFEDFLFGWMD